MKPWMNLAAGMLAAALSGPAFAEKADKDKPADIEYFGKATMNELSQTQIIEGNVVLTKGTIRLTATRLEVKQDPQGYQFMVATGKPGATATFRQKREGVNEFVTGEADRIEFDGKADTVVFVKQAILRTVDPQNTIINEARGARIFYDNKIEQFEVEGGAESGLKDGRGRIILTPKVSPTPAPAKAGEVKK
ncbi:MAG: lipopolysaccharide transport periplasmic protein LptA [Pseudomonadota bacterium]|jgi:lipopolysaccharide export system protein LptA